MNSSTFGQVLLGVISFWTELPWPWCTSTRNLAKLSVSKCCEKGRTSVLRALKWRWNVCRELKKDAAIQQHQLSKTIKSPSWKTESREKSDPIPNCVLISKICSKRKTPNIWRVVLKNTTVIFLKNMSIRTGRVCSVGNCKSYYLNNLRYWEIASWKIRL